MASIRISQLASVSAVTADDFLIVNDGDINTRKISYANFSAGLLSATAASQTITGSLTVTGTVAATDLNIDSGVLSVVSTTNKVGINVAGPAYDLDIAGDAQIRGGNRLLLADTTNVHTVSLQAPGTLTVSSAYTLPTAYPASNGMALVSTVAGAMDWAAILTDPLSGIGQMIVRNASNVTSPLSPGTLNQVLAIGADSVPHWVTAPSGFADPMTTAGDIIIRNASNVTSRLGIGTAGQTLVVSAGAPAWGTGAVVAGSNGQIQFNSSGSFSGNSNLTFTAGTNTLGATAISTTQLTVASTLNVLGGVTLGDANTDTITFTGRANSNLVPLTNNSVDLGGPSLKWNNAYINLLNAGGLVYPTADGTAGQVLVTDGAGNLDFQTNSVTPAGSDTQIQFNNSGALGASSGLTFNDVSDTLTTVNVATTTFASTSSATFMGGNWIIDTNNVLDGYRPTATAGDDLVVLRSDVGGALSTQFEVAANGQISAAQTSINPISSERRLKENLVAVDSVTAWNTVKETPYYAYNFIGSDAVSYGPMADEVPDEMRIATDRSDDVGTIHTYDHGMLQARLYTALQTALTRIEELEARLDAAGV
jgi:hypothetical protein